MEQNIYKDLMKNTLIKIINKHIMLKEIKYMMLINQNKVISMVHIVIKMEYIL